MGKVFADLFSLDDPTCQLLSAKILNRDCLTPYAGSDVQIQNDDLMVATNMKTGYARELCVMVEITNNNYG